MSPENLNNNIDEEEKDNLAYDFRNIKHKELFWDIAYDFPSDFVLFYLYGAAENKLDIHERIFSEYRIKYKWHNAIKRLKRRKLILFSSKIKLHRIEPELVDLSKYGREVFNDWSETKLFDLCLKGLKKYANSTDGFITYFFQKIVHPDDEFINKIKIKRKKKGKTFKIILSCGICGKRCDYFPFLSEYEKCKRKGHVYSISCVNCATLKIRSTFHINFQDEYFFTDIYYLKSFRDFNFRPEKSKAKTDITIILNRKRIEIRNISRNRFESFSTPMRKTTIERNITTYDKIQIEETKEDYETPLKELRSNFSNKLEEKKNLLLDLFKNSFRQELVNNEKISAKFRSFKKSIEVRIEIEVRNMEKLETTREIFKKFENFVKFLNDKKKELNDYARELETYRQKSEQLLLKKERIAEPVSEVHIEEPLIEEKKLVKEEFEKILKRNRKKFSHLLTNTLIQRKKELKAIEEKILDDKMLEEKRKGIEIQEKVRIHKEIREDIFYFTEKVCKEITIEKLNKRKKKLKPSLFKKRMCYRFNEFLGGIDPIYREEYKDVFDGYLKFDLTGDMLSCEKMLKRKVRPRLSRSKLGTDVLQETKRFALNSKLVAGIILSVVLLFVVFGFLLIIGNYLSSEINTFLIQNPMILHLAFFFVIMGIIVLILSLLYFAS